MSIQSQKPVPHLGTDLRRLLFAAGQRENIRADNHALTSVEPLPRVMFI